MRSLPAPFRGNIHSLEDVTKYVFGRVEIKLVYKGNLAYYFNSTSEWNEAYWFPGLDPVILTGGRKDCTPEHARAYINKPVVDVEEQVRAFVKKVIYTDTPQSEKELVAELMAIITGSGK